MAPPTVATALVRFHAAFDAGDLDQVMTFFAPDAVCAYGDGKFSFAGRDAIVAWLREAMDGNLITLHQVHHPEIDLTGPTTARGTWYLEDYVINPGPARPAMPGWSILRGSAFYKGEYVKQAGQWKLALIGYERSLRGGRGGRREGPEAHEPLGEGGLSARGPDFA